MLNAVKVRRVKSKLDEAAAARQEDESEVIEQTQFVSDVMGRTTFAFNGLTLVETRSTGTTNFATVPVSIGGVSVRLGQARSTRRETMQAIDQGTFRVERDRATFVGGKHNRTWEYKKLVGYNVDGGSELLIAVTNRQRMSGVRYGAKSDFIIDSAFCAAVERSRGNTAAVKAWVQQTIDQLQTTNDESKTRFEETARDLAADLVDLVGRDEAIDHLRTVPGLNVG